MNRYLKVSLAGFAVAAFSLAALALAVDEPIVAGKQITALRFERSEVRIRVAGVDPNGEVVGAPVINLSMVDAMADPNLSAAMKTDWIRTLKQMARYRKAIQ